MRKLTLLFAVLLSLVGVTRASADELTVFDGSGSSTYYPVHGNYADNNNSLSEFIIPASALSEMAGTSISKMTFYISSVAEQAWTSTFTVYMKEIEATVFESTSAIGDTDATVVYVGTLDGTSSTMDVNFTDNYDYEGGNLLIGFKVTENGSVWKAAEFVGETQSTNTAFRNKSSNQKEKFLPKTTFTYSPAPVEGAALVVKDGSKKLSSPYAYNFGLAVAGATKTFTLTNPGTEDFTVTVAETGDFGATLSATTIPVGGEVTLTLTAPEATGNSEVTISADAEGIEDFVINVSATIRDANKMFINFADADATSEWQNNNWTLYTTGGGEGSTGGGYAIQESTNYSNYRLVTEKITFAEGEKLMFLAEGKASSGSISSYTKLNVQYSTDGATWTDALTIASTDLSTSWQQFSATMPAGSYYVGFYGAYTKITDIYGGELAQEPKFVVTQPEALAYGVITEETAKTFTIANPGRAELTNISVSSSNELFTITGAPESLDAGSSAEVTITMSADKVGAHNATITVTADGFDPVVFTVTGTVLPTGLSVIDFADGLPSRWSNESSSSYSSGWTFSEGIASTGSYTCTMTTPKVVVAEDDMLVVKARLNYDSSNDYVTVNGLNAEGEAVYTKKLSNDVLNSDDYTAVLLTGISTDVTAFQFVGYYAYIDEIQGINYAADLVVTKGDEAVSSGDTHDFGEIAAEATVSYTFTNAGAGTITVTDVEVTGEGATAYSTNWNAESEGEAVPFKLTITRNYDSERTEASEAVVTVTTTEGTFTINVTGTDKPANAPELTLSTTDIDFGKLLKRGTQTVTVTNSGTGLLSVTIVSSSEDITVSTATLTDIAAGESKTFDVTFVYTEGNYGAKAATITVTPDYDTEAAVSIAVKGKAQDPDAWTEEFASDELPIGWDAGSNWTIADGVATAKYVYGSTGYLTTPILAVAGETDELTFDYVATAGYVSITIEMSKDGAAFTQLNKISLSNNGDADTYTITGLEAGDYQFRFASDDYQLDNFEGFKLNLPDHMAAITSYTIPDSYSWGPTMKEGKSFEATVTVKESCGKSEELTAKLYMGDAVIGTATATVEALASQTLTIVATPTEPATDGVEMHIEVEWAGDKLTTETVTRYVSAYLTLALTEDEANEINTNTTYDRITLKRSFAAEWNSFIAPLAVNVSDLGEGAKVYEFTGYADGILSFNVVTSETLTAGTPYIVYMPEPIDEKTFTWENTSISYSAVGDYAQVTRNGVVFKGTYSPIERPEMEGYYGVTDEGRIQKGSAEASILAFRAYFQLPAEVEAEVKAIEYADFGIVVRVAPLAKATTASDARTYDLAGRRVASNARGIVVKNGKKILQ